MMPKAQCRLLRAAGLLLPALLCTCCLISADLPVQPSSRAARIDMSRLRDTGKATARCALAACRHPQLHAAYCKFCTLMDQDIAPGAWLLARRKAAQHSALCLHSHAQVAPAGVEAALPHHLLVDRAPIPDLIVIQHLQSSDTCCSLRDWLHMSGMASLHVLH